MNGISQAAGPRAGTYVRLSHVLPRTGHRADVLVRVTVWGSLIVLTFIALLMIALYGRDLPLAEDWLMVAPLTANEPSLLHWLWEPNNEHRIALPRLLYLGILALAGGDFRAGMVVNTLLLSALAAACLRVAAARPGGLRLTDAVLPLLLLHLGHWANLAWGWQIQFVSAVVLTCLPLLVIVRHGAEPSRGASIVVAVSLALLPLTGANGLIFALAFIPWFAAIAVRLRGAAHSQDADATAMYRPDRRHLWLLAGVLTAALLSIVYLAQYERPPWIPENPGLVETILTSVRFIGMSVGPALWEYQSPILVALAILLLGAGVAWIHGAHSAWREGNSPELWRAAGLLCFAGGCIVLTAVMGYGRAAYVPSVGMPMRYALLAAPILVCAYFLWDLYAPRRMGTAGQMALLALLLLCLPANVRGGFVWKNWYVPASEAVLADVEAGMPAGELARRHGEFLLHWNAEMLHSRIVMLRDAGIGPFARVPVSPQVRD